MQDHKNIKQDKKNNSEGSFLKWWKKNKTKIGIVSVIVSFTVAFNLFLYQWVITPSTEKRVLEAEIELFKNTKEIKENYEEQIKNLRYIINNKEGELESLKIKLVQLKNQGVDQKETELLMREIDLKEQEIKFYKRQIANLKDQLTKANKLIEASKRSKLVTNFISPAKVLAPVITRFRSQPAFLSYDEVKSALIRYNFFEYSLNENGQGFRNQFEVKIINDDKVIVDHAAGLMWQQSGSHNLLNYSIYDLEVKEYIKKINQQSYAGFNDWRLPTLEEAMSLMEPKRKNDLYIDSVFDSTQLWIWTADQVKGKVWSAWTVDFSFGTQGYCYRYSHYIPKFWVRAVRSAQSFQE